MGGGRRAQPRDPRRQTWELIIKAITYHNLVVRQAAGEPDALGLLVRYYVLLTATVAVAVLGLPIVHRAASDLRNLRAGIAALIALGAFSAYGTTTLAGVAPALVAKTAAGDEVYLKADGDGLKVENAQGEILGAVEAKLGLRLICASYRMLEFELINTYLRRKVYTDV